MRGIKMNEIYLWLIGISVYLIGARIVYSYFKWIDGVEESGCHIMAPLFWPILLIFSLLILFFDPEFIMGSIKKYNRERTLNQRKYKFSKMEDLKKEIEELKVQTSL